MDSPNTLPFTNEELDKAGLRGEGESLSASSIASSATAPYDLSVWERTTYYNGISPDHPELLYRSDLLENPFPIPEGRHPLPSPSMESSIREVLKDRKLRYSAFTAARFITHGEDEESTLGPVVIWIGAPPNTTTAKNAHDASPDILALLEANGVEGAVVEWYEAVVERL